MKIATRDIPAAACRIRGGDAMVRLSAEPDAETGEGEARQRRFTMLANSGAPMNLGWWGMFVIDLSGLTMQPKTALLQDHDVSLRAGYTDRLEVTARGLEAEGVMLDNEVARAILADADQGFPWQASIWLEPTQVQELWEGETAEVNGQMVTGPMSIARSGLVREVSFVTLGADANTEAAAASGDRRPISCQFQHEDQMTKTTKTTAPKTAAGSPETQAERLARTAIDTAEDVERAFPEQAEALRLAGIADGIGDERDRVDAILAASDDAQRELVRELVQSGAAATDAVLRLNADLRERLAAAQTATLGGAATRSSLARGNVETAASDGSTALRSKFPAGERGDKQFEAYMRRHAD